MKSHSDFKIGRKYECTFNPTIGVLLCIGIHPVNQRAILEKPAGRFHIVSSPENWIEHREPREFHMAVGHRGSKYGPAFVWDDSVHNMRAAGYEVIKVREVIE